VNTGASAPPFGELMSVTTIRDVRTILTMPSYSRLVIVKVETSEPGLYGVGCATFTQRHLTVHSAVEDFLKPFLIGKNVQCIEDLWQTMMVNPYWRNGPDDTSPVGHAANLHLDVNSPNFGIQEWSGFNEQLREVFPGCPEVRNGYMYPNDKPGLGIDIDEKEAAKYPCPDGPPEWTLTRTPDGTAVRP
jgi:L-alanine-DL-glutamate epimerase-like enolase superfamily enzyme